MGNLEKILTAIDALLKQYPQEMGNFKETKDIYKYYLCWCEADNIHDESYKAMAWALMEGYAYGIDLDDASLEHQTEMLLSDTPLEEILESIFYVCFDFKIN